MGSRIKKYRMKAIPSAFSEKGGFSAQFIGDGYSVDARTEILPSVISASGVQVGEGTAWELVTAFLKACAQRAANTGETVNVGSLVTFGLAIKGWYSNKDSKADKDAVRVTATLLGDLKPTVAFSMSNALEGATLVLYTVMSDGCGLGHVMQGAAFHINGKELKMLEGDSVSAEMKTADGTKIAAECEITGSDDDHIDAVLPAAFSGEECVGRPITFKVTGRCGDPEAGEQTKTIEATIDAAETPPAPTVPTLDEVRTDGMENGEIVWDDDIKMGGANLALGTGGKVEAQIEDSEDPWVDLTSYVDGEASGAGLIVLKGARGSETDEGVWNALGEMELPTTEGRVRFRVTTDGGEDTIVAETVG